jgi:hypothetical protein
MTHDLFCEWGVWLTGLESASCWVERKRRGTLVAVAGLAGLGLVMDGAAFWRRWRRRAAAGVSSERGERHAWAGRFRLAISITLLLGWWLYWYTDRMALYREGIEHFVPVSAQPPTFFWLTAVLTTWCLLGMARFAMGRVEARR